MIKIKKESDYSRWFADDFSRKQFKEMAFTKEEAKLFEAEEYRIYKQSPEHHLSGGYFHFKVTDLETDYDDKGKKFYKFHLSMVWGVEGESQDFGNCYFDRTNKKFIKEGGL